MKLVHAACPLARSFCMPKRPVKASCPCFISMSLWCISGVHAHAACPRCMSKVLVSAEDLFCMTCCMNMLHENVAWAEHEHKHKMNMECENRHKKKNAACPFCMSILHANAACPCFMSMLHAMSLWACPYKCWLSIMNVHFAWPFCISMLHVYSSCLCSISMSPCCLSIRVQWFWPFFKIQFIHAFLVREWDPKIEILNVFFLIFSLCIADFIISF